MSFSLGVGAKFCGHVLGTGCCGRFRVSVEEELVSDVLGTWWGLGALRKSIGVVVIRRALFLALAYRSISFVKKGLSALGLVWWALRISWSEMEVCNGILKIFILLSCIPCEVLSNVYIFIL